MMDFNLIKLIFTLINFGICIAIITIIIKGIKKFTCFINENREMSKKIDCILKKLEK